jgi:hypothetical protein
MSELRESLDQAMRTVTVGEPPVDAAMRRGRAIRHRRRVTVLASALAVAAASGVAYPAVTHLRSAPAPATTHRVVITDIPPGPGSAAGLVASGMIGDKSWRVIVDKPRQLGGAGIQQCFSAQGTAFGASQGSAQNCGPQLAPSADPVQFTGSGDGGNEAQVGAVAADVTYLVVTLDDGQQLKLIPVRLYGTRLVAFAAPMGAGVASAVAYRNDGQYRIAIPASLPGDLPVFGAWLAPGQHGQARATGRVAAGTVDGQAWSVTAYIGPWGVCFTTAPGVAGCDEAIAPLTTTGVLGSQGSGPPQVVYGTAASAVSYLMVTLTSGQAFRVPVAVVGGQKLFAFALGKGQTLKKWTAYDAAGHPLSSGGL